MSGDGDTQREGVAGGDPVADAERPAAASLRRRTFLIGLGGAAGLAALGAAAAAEVLGGTPRRSEGQRAGGAGGTTTTEPAVTMTSLPGGAQIPVAEWVVDENGKPGTLAWLISLPPGAGRIEGYAGTVSTTIGVPVTLYVNTTDPSFHVEAYRMGYYGGLGARLVDTSPPVKGMRQPDPVVVPTVNMVECRWTASITMPITSAWPPGDYLLKLVGSSGAQAFVPLCVRDDASTAAFVIQNSVTTWQAYNRYGGYSLYYGPGPSSTRSRVVSFDRPYPFSWAWGSADFLGNEFPVVHLAERLGLDVTYRTDIDLHQDPARLLRNKCLLSLGHDEYWSTTMRDGAIAARDAGVNLCFLGANPVYRHIRLQSSPVGPLRQQVCYKTDFMKEDPLWGVDPAEVTANWATGPVAWPEQQLVGNEYQDVDANADMVIVDPASWLVAGLGLQQGARLPGVVLGEYDRYEPGLPGPRNVSLIAHSPVPNRGARAAADVTYYSAPSGAGVLAVGTASFVNLAWTESKVPTDVIRPGGKVDANAAVLQGMIENVFSVMGAGPAGRTHPSTANWQGLA
jgi:hypothetical protein